MDPPGAPEQRNVFMPVLSGNNGAVVLYDITSLESFLNARNWIKLVKSKSGSNIVISLVGNKLDSAQANDSREVERAQAEAFCAENNITFSETCAINRSSTLVIERLVKKVVFVHRDRKIPAEQPNVPKTKEQREVDDLLQKLKEIEKSDNT